MIEHEAESKHTTIKQYCNSVCMHRERNGCRPSSSTNLEGEPGQGSVRSRHQRAPRRKWPPSFSCPLACRCRMLVGFSPVPTCTCHGAGDRGAPRARLCVIHPFDACVPVCPVGGMHQQQQPCQFADADSESGITTTVYCTQQAAPLSLYPQQ